MDNQSTNFAITPDTKLGALLDHYPQLEQVLIEMAPAFKKLRNPILRKTVAKVATLRQVAQVGDISLPALINTLRQKLGQEGSFEDDAQQHESPTTPAWFDSSKIVKSLDARSIIESGHQPMNQVLEELKNLKTREIYELITPFVPAPLIEMVKKKGFQVWSLNVERDLIETYIFHS